MIDRIALVAPTGCPAGGLATLGRVRGCAKATYLYIDVAMLYRRQGNNAALLVGSELGRDEWTGRVACEPKGESDECNRNTTHR